MNVWCFVAVYVVAVGALWFTYSRRSRTEWLRQSFGRDVLIIVGAGLGIAAPMMIVVSVLAWLGMPLPASAVVALLLYWLILINGVREADSGTGAEGGT